MKASSKKVHKSLRQPATDKFAEERDYFAAQQKAQILPPSIQTGTVQGLQRVIGNRALQRMLVQADLPSGLIQPVRTVTRKRGGTVKIAESEQEARTICEQACEGEGLDFYELPEFVRDRGIEISQSVKEGGIEHAKAFVTADAIDKRSTEQRKKRESLAADDWEIAETLGNIDSLAYDALSISYHGYLDFRNNVGLGGTYTTDEAIAALNEWRNLGAYFENVTNFHGYKPTDKKAQGKGNVGGTLAKRETQANLICKWRGFKVNVHIDIRD